MSKLDELIQELCPDGVERVALGEVLTVQNGAAFQSTYFNTLGDGIPLIRVRDVNTGFSNTYYSGAYEDDYLVQNGDILIGMDGDFKVKKWADGAALLNQRVARLTHFSNQVIPDFVLYQLQPELLKIQNSTQSSTVKHLSSRTIANISIPFPPLGVQEEIVRILDQFVELDCELDQEIAGREKQFRNVMWSLMESVDLAKVETLGSISTISTGQAMSKKTIEANPGEYPVVNSGIEPLGYISKWNTDSIPIGVTSRGANVGHVSWTEGKLFRGPLNYGIDVSSAADVLTRFLFFTLLHNQDGIHNLCTHQGIPALNKSNLSNLPIPLPPLEVQEEFVAKLDTFTEYIENLKRERELRQKQYEYYRDQLLDFEAKE